MPDHRRHRGPHPGDRERFAAPVLPVLRQAGADLALLLDRGYPARASLKLVGDRFAFDERQRLALLRGVCSRRTAAARRARLLPVDALRGATVWIDGFNVLTTVEAALAGGLTLRCHDGCLRDLASMHGTFRRVHETEPAAVLVGDLLAASGAAAVRVLLDQPVSNAGRLAQRLRALAKAHGFPWQVDVVPSPDRELAACGAVAATADGPVLDRCGRWFDLARAVVERSVPAAWIVDLAGAGPEPPAPQPDGVR